MKPLSILLVSLLLSTWEALHVNAYGYGRLLILYCWRLAPNGNEENIEEMTTMMIILDAFVVASNVLWLSQQQILLLVFLLSLALLYSI